MVLYRKGTERLVLPKYWPHNEELNRRIAQITAQRLFPEAKEGFVLSTYWPHNKELNRRITHIVAERWLPQAIERFEEGILPLRFGPLLLDRAGIRHGRKTISWSDIEDVQDKNDRLALKTQGKWQRYMLIETPLVVALAKHAIRSRCWQHTP